MAAWPAGRSLRRAAGRRGDRGPGRVPAGRTRRDGRVRRPGARLFRRWALRVGRGAHAPGAGVRQGFRRGHRPARAGAKADRGRADERGRGIGPPGPDRLASRRRGGDHRPGLPARRPRWFRAAHLPRVHGRVRGDHPLGEVQGLAGHGRGHPAPSAAYRRSGGQLRPGVQGEPAAAHRGRRRRATAGPGRRHHRLRGDRPRAASGGGQGNRVGGRGPRHDRPGDRAARGAGGDGRDRPARLGGGRRPDVGQARCHRPAARARTAARGGVAGEPGPLRPRASRGRGPGHARLPEPQLTVRRARAARPGDRDLPSWPPDRTRGESHLMAGAAGRTAGWPAVLVLEDGTTFHGTGFGAEGETFGEMVFSTGMTGYQETLTDPSYCRQIVAMTAPHIGNTGVNDDDPESGQIWVSGYVVREPARIVSSWRARRSLDEELAAQGIPGIAITGTRALTRRLREHGAMRAAISTAGPDPAQLLDRVLASPPMTGADLARVVSTADPYTVSPPGGEPVRYRVAAVDLGTYKLRFGHRGINQPVKDLATGRVQITSHNHGFAVAPPGDRGTFVMHDLDASRPFDTAFGRAQVSHVNLNDGVVEGIRLLDAPAFSVQYHPEAAPGPHDAAGEFDAFCALIQGARRAQA